MDVDPKEAEEWKAKGDAAFRKGDYDTAASMYAVAIDIDQTNATLRGNLSATYYKLSCNKFAVYAAQEAIELNPKWAKAHVRLAIALCSLYNFTSAINAYQTAISLEPGNREWKDGLQEVYKAMQTSIMNPTGFLGYNNADLSEIFNRAFMEKMWPTNIWWYTPTSLDNPRHTFQEQWELVMAFRAIGTSEPKKVPYSAMGFSPDINIMRGTSVMLHPTFLIGVLGAEDPFYAHCRLNGAVPDVLLWAPDIYVQLMLTMITDEAGRHHYHEVTLYMTQENAQMGATIEKQKLKWTEELLQRAWKEAMQIEELYPLALILYPAMLIRYRNKRSEDKHFSLVRDFINICAKMKIDGFRGLLEARIDYAALLEKRGTKDERKQIWKTISNFSGKARHKHEQRFFSSTKNGALTNVAMFLKKEKKYDEAWVIFQEAFKDAINQDLNLCVKDVMLGIFDIFLQDDWQTREWREKEATNFYKMARGYPSFPKMMNIPKHDLFWPKVLANCKMPNEDYVEFGDQLPPDVPRGSLADQLFTEKKLVVNRMCAYCHKNTAKHLCSGCKTEYFCNTECQKAGWKTHKLMCKNIRLVRGEKNKQI